MNQIRKIVIAILTIALIAGFSAFSVYAIQRTLMSHSQPNIVSTPVEVPAPEQNPELLAILQSLGATHISDLSIVYGADMPDNFRAEYSPNEKSITVKPSSDQAQVARSIAHEYLHHVWYTVMSEDVKASITSDLFVLYANDAGIQDRVGFYVDAGMLRPTELFSIYCTESTDAYMLTIVNECNKYIDRSKLVLTR